MIFLVCWNTITYESGEKSMKRFSKFIVNHSILVVILSAFLMIPAIWGYFNTRINYDILVYLPESNETIQGEKILTEDIGLGAYAFVMVDNMGNHQILNLEEKIKEIKGINMVASAVDIVGTAIPKEMLPDEVLSKLYHDDGTILFVTFKEGTSSDQTLNAFRKLRTTVGDASKVAGMSALVLDTNDLSNQEMLIYVVIAVVLCSLILFIATDSYLLPVFLLGNIGVAILYNLGTNIFLGEISYITKAIVAVLQLGVTTDFSIFLYHKYIQAKDRVKDNKRAMEEAIMETFKSVIGSSLTTFAGFLALCTMDLTLGCDIGIVMAKGVLFGLICVMTLFPALLLVFDKALMRTRHRIFLPQFKTLQEFSIKHKKIILAIFVILILPAFYGYSHYQVYYKLDESMPEDMPYNKSNQLLKEKYNINSMQIVLLDKNVSSNKIDEMSEKLSSLKGIQFAVSPAKINELGIPSDLLGEKLDHLIHNDKYQLMLISSDYEIASNSLNHQIKEIKKIVKKYDKGAIVAGEGALMKDLVTIADHDFNMVTYTSLLVILIIMILALKSFGLPIILICAIEFAIFVNMAISYYTGVTLPFVASIVVGTIQLGATIDYAILMSTKYLEERGKTANKNTAIKNTLSVTIPSIITSALCFFGATFGVAMYTKIDMIGSICELLCRGAMISMIVVVTILPVLLVTFDSFIMKTTKLKKERI